jgi:hypothetical protein
MFNSILKNQIGGKSIKKIKNLESIEFTSQIHDSNYETETTQ